MQRSLWLLMELLHIPSTTTAHDNAFTLKWTVTKLGHPNPGITNKPHPETTKHTCNKTTCLYLQAADEELQRKGRRQSFPTADTSPLQWHQRSCIHMDLLLGQLDIAENGVAATFFPVRPTGYLSAQEVYNKNKMEQVSHFTSLGLSPSLAKNLDLCLSLPLQSPRPTSHCPSHTCKQLTSHSLANNACTTKNIKHVSQYASHHLFPPPAANTSAY